MKFIKICGLLLLCISPIAYSACPIVLEGVQTTNATCNGGNDGTVTVQATGGSAALQYSIDGGATYELSPTFTGFPAGNYTLDIWVQDFVCTATSGIFELTITQPAAIVISAVSVINNTCNGASAGRITVTASGGTPPLQYSIDNGSTYQSSNVFNALPAGAYNVRVRDANGCVRSYASNPVNITQPAAIIVGATKTDVTCNGFSDGQITVTASGGTGALVYSINGGALYTVSNVFTGLSGGSYTVQVRDANNCVVPYGGNPVIVVDPALPVITTVSSTNALCFAGANGTITITGATGGTPPYTYALNDLVYQSSPVFTGLLAGSYYADIKDANGCETAFAGNPIIISQPTKIVFDVSETNACGPSPAQGTITILNVSGGTPGYQYSVDNGATWSPSSLFNVDPGSYNVAVKDSNDCFVEFPFNPIVINRMTVATVKTDVTCYAGSNGTITVTPTGGITPYSYAISSNGGVSFGPASANITGLGAGSYIVRVTDGVGSCQIDTTVVITQPSAVTIAIVQQNPTTCGATDGSIAVTVTGGTPNYQYSIDGGSTWQPAIPTASTTFTFTNLSQGFYTVRVRYGIGGTQCELSYPANPVILNDAGAATFSITTTPVSPCFGNNNGSLTISASGGTSPYQYSIDNGSTYTTSPVFTTLAAGSYLVKVRDSSSPSVCTSNAVAIVGTAAQLSFSVLSRNACNSIGGYIEITYPTGGVPPYQFTINGTTWQSSPVFLNVVPGSYNNIAMRDSSLCSRAYGSVVTVGDLTLSATQTNVTCYGGSDGSITFTTVGSVVPYRFSTNGGASWVDITSTTTAGLTAGSYRIAVQNSTQTCRLQAAVIITQPNRILVKVTTTSPTCFGFSNGTITIKATGGTGTLQYSINNGATYQLSNVFTGLPIGTYLIKVKDASNCTVPFDNPVIITQPTQVVATVAQTNVLCNGASTGSIVVTASGGTGTLQYSKDGGATYQVSRTFSALPAAVYTIVVKDANNCVTAPQVITITQPTALVINTVTKTDVTQCFGNTNGSITISLSGGTPNYQYSINNGSTFFPSGRTPLTSWTFNSLGAGNYTIVVRDQNNCRTTYGVITLTQPPQIVVTNITKTDVTTCFGGNNGTITVTASGGTGTLEYSLNGGAYQLSNVFTGLTVGFYTVRVRDANSCVITYPAQIPINQPNQITFVLQHTDALCPGGADGVVTVTNVVGAGGPYQYSLNGGAYQLSNVFTGLAAATYSVTVKDINGCTSSKSVTVGQPGIIVIAISNITQPICPSDDGTFNVNVTGGTPQYIVFLDGVPVAITVGGQATISAAPGSYSLSLEDAHGCFQSYSPAIVINDPPIFFITAAKTDESTCPNNDAIITTTVTGGVAPFTYYLNGPVSMTYGPTSDLAHTFTGLVPGTYSTYVIDDRECASNEVMLSISVMNLDFTLSVSATDISCFGFNDGSITIDVFDTEGHTLFAYSLDNGATWTNNGISYTFDNLTAGLYGLLVKDLIDLCQSSTFVILDQPEQFNSTILNIESPVCFGNDGSIIFEANGGVPLYTALLDGNQVATGFGSFEQVTIPVAVGDHLLTVYDEHLCFVSLPFTMNGPDAVAFTTTFTNVSCNGFADGSITINATGGNGEYTYLVNGLLYGPAPSPYTIFNLLPDLYTIVVTDTNQCPASDSQVVQITEPQQVVVSIISVTAPTFTGNGSVTVNVVGGTPPYTLTCGGQEKQAQENVPVTFYLPTGTYELTVRDSHDCCPPLIRTSRQHVMRSHPPCQTFTIVIPDPQVPAGACCCQVLHQFPTSGDLVNIVSWTSYEGAVRYVVSADVARMYVLAVVNSSQPLVYCQHCCIPGVSNTYYIFAVDANGNYSQPAVVRS